MGDIRRFNAMIESGDYANVDEKNNILQGIKEQVKALKRTLANYPDFYAKAFPPHYPSVAGKWRWFNGGLITLTSNGNIEGNGKILGIYSFNGSDCTLSWKNRYTDKLKISTDGNRLSGRNQNGTPVSAEKIKTE